MRMCAYYDLVAVRLFSEIVVDTLRPVVFFSSKDTEDSCIAGGKMFSKMVSLWEPLLPCPFTEYDHWDSEDSEDNDVDD